MILGIIVTNLTQERDYYTDIAKYGKTKKITVHLFLPADIDLQKKTAKGLTFCNQSVQWMEDIFPIPTIIYDRCFYENKDVFYKHYAHVNWLKKQSANVFLGHGLPNKWVVYNVLKQDPVVSKYLPATHQLKDFTQLLSMLDKQNSILAKPISGSQGKGIFVLTKSEDHFLLLAKKGATPYYKRLNIGKLEHLTHKLINSHNYLLQPFLSLKTNDQRPFDVRIFLQKNQTGNWEEVGRGIRIGSKGDYTSNLGMGGKVTSYPEWMERLTLKQQNDLQNSLHQLLPRIPEVLEQSGFSLFELGLDFGFDQEGRLWLLEVNSKPGRKVIITSYPHKKSSLAEAPLNYGLFLSEKNNRKEREFEK